MILKKIEIENVKTHKKSIIPFKSGLNVLYGDNGAGKSTVLEMIGFVLFDFLKSKSHKDFVRDVKDDKPEYGTITLYILGSDDEMYKIIRTIGKTSIAVYKGRTEKLLKNIDSIGKYTNWIKKQLGIKREVDLGTLFDTAIGIPQGLIVEPFLKAPDPRKKYFDKILQLESYETCWKNMGALKSKIKPDLEVIREKISNIEGGIENKSELEEKRLDIENEIITIEGTINSNEKQEESLEVQLNSLDDIKKGIEKAEKEKSELKLKKTQFEQNLRELKQQLEEAEKAKEICVNNKAAHDTYLKLSSEYDDYLTRNEKINKLKDTLTRVNENYLKAQGLYDQKLKEIDKAKESKEKMEELEPKFKRFNEIENELNDVKINLSNVERDEKELSTFQARYKALQTDLLNTEKQLEDLPLLNKELEELGSIETDVKELRLKTGILENEIAFFENNQNIMKTGKCPFSNQECLNIKNGIMEKDHLAQQIQMKVDLLDNTKKTIKEIGEKTNKKDHVQKELEKLKEKEYKKGEINRNLQDLSDKIKEFEAAIAPKTELVKKKSDLISEREKLQVNADEYIVHKNKAEFFDELKQNLKPLEANMLKFKGDKEALTKQINDAGDVTELIKKTKTKMESLKKGHDEYQQNVKIAENVDKRKNKVGTTTAELTNINQELVKISEILNQLKNQFNQEEYDNLKSKITELGKTTANLKGQLKGKREKLKEIDEQLEEIKIKELQLKDKVEEKNKIQVQLKFVKKSRHWLRSFIPNMRKSLIDRINKQATQIFRSIRENDNSMLEWKEDYDIIIRTSETEKNFFKLSGGEKMSAALAVRLAILRVLTSAEFAFFDEPTTNLDPTSRNNLSQYINNITGFNQLFVISHDDSFKRHSEYVVKFLKDQDETTQIEVLTAPPE